MSTFMANNQNISPEWTLIDAKGLTLGRLASEIARRLRGKHKPTFTPHVDTGDYIIVINARHVKVTGNKATGKLYQRHTGFPGGIRTINFIDLIKKHPIRPIEKAVKRMLPRGPLGRQMYRKLKVYADAEHPHAAQNPAKIDLQKKTEEEA